MTSMGDQNAQRVWWVDLSIQYYAFFGFSWPPIQFPAEIAAGVVLIGSSQWTRLKCYGIWPKPMLLFLSH